MIWSQLRLLPIFIGSIVGAIEVHLAFLFLTGGAIIVSIILGYKEFD